DDAELLGFHRGHEAVALDRRRDRFERLAGMLDIDLVEARPQPQDLARLDLDVAGLALEAARGLVDHNVRVRQAEAPALGAGGEQQGAHRGGLANAYGRDRRADVLHGVVDRQPGGDDPAWRVDVEGDILARVLRFEEQELGADQACDGVMYRADEKD